MKNRRLTIITFQCLAWLTLSPPVVAVAARDAPTSGTVRFGQFNIRELSTENLTNVDEQGAGRSEQLRAAAVVIRQVRPDVLVINEIDHDVAAVEQGGDYALNARRFNDAYLNRGAQALDYPYVYAAPCNTGLPAGKDFDNDGKIATAADRRTRVHGNDCFGYGEYPGQYSMAILSRFPLDAARSRTFQKFLWKDLPGNLLPADFYAPDEAEIFRLSSKSHWDVPVIINGRAIHLLVSHPTPPVFDGPEDRNGRRNFDEVRFWALYLNDDPALIDDAGTSGGLAEMEHFIIAGDLNASPRGDQLESGRRAIEQLLNHPRVLDSGEWLTSRGGLDGRQPGAPDFPERNTAGWAGGHRVDYLLPDRGLQPVAGGVYWPDAAADPDGHALAQKASDHFMIWLDLEVK